MANKKTLEKLAEKDLWLLDMHYDVKELIPESDAKLLLDNGFMDRSWSDDETACYVTDSHPCAEPIYLFVLNDNGVIYYTITRYESNEYTFIPSTNLPSVIKEYKKLIKMADDSGKSEVN